MKDQNFAVPNFFGTYEIKDGLTAGIGVYSPFGLGTEWPSDWVGRASSTKADIKTLFVNPAIGYTLPDFGIGKVRVGAGLMAAVYGKVKLARAVRDFTPEGTFTLDGDLDKTAYGFNAGIQYEPMDKLTLGFTYRSEVKMKFKGNANFNNLSVGFPPTAQGSSEITMPSSWVAAINVRPMPGLTAEFDYVWWGWSSYDNLVITFDQTIPALGSNQINNKRNYQNSWQGRFGVEYSKLPIQGLTVRAGIAYDKNPIKDHYVDPTLPDANRWLFSGGVSYDVTNYLAIDASYIFIRAKQRQVTQTESGVNGVYNTYANLPGLGLTLKF